MVRKKPRMSDSYILKQFFNIYFVYKDPVWPRDNTHNVVGRLSYWVSGETAPIVSALLLGFKCANLSPSQSSKSPESWHEAGGLPSRVPREWQPAVLTLLKREEIVDNGKNHSQDGALAKKKGFHDHSALNITLCVLHLPGPFSVSHLVGGGE